MTGAVRAFGSSTLPSTIDCAKSETGGRMQMALNKRSLNKPIGHQLSSRRAEPKACLPAGAHGELVRRGKRTLRANSSPPCREPDRSFLWQAAQVGRFTESPDGNCRNGSGAFESTAPSSLFSYAIS